MARLPRPGLDDGTWGGILNDFLGQAHNPDGTLKPNSVTTSQLAPGSVTSAALAAGTVASANLADNSVTNVKLDSSTQAIIASVAAKYIKPAGGVPLTDLSSSLRANLTKAGTSVQQVNNKTPDGSGVVSLTAADVGAATSLGGLSDVNATGATNSQVLSYNTGSSKWTAATVTSTTVSDASNTGKGILQLAGDLAGSNDPTNPTISTGAITDAKVATGAAISQSKIQNLTTNLAAKAPLASPTFSGTVTVPTPANPTDATTKGYVDSQVTTGSTPDASLTTKGKIQLAGDLAGTAASPTVAKLSGVSLAGLATGLLKNTTGTGVPSIATASDIPDLSATYATATALTTEASTARTAESKAVPRWAPTTTYTLGQQVVSPNNDVVSAIAAHTSGASFTPANWAVSSTYAPQDQAWVETSSPLSAAPGFPTYSTFADFVMDPDGTTIHQFASAGGASIWHATSPNGLDWTWDGAHMFYAGVNTWENQGCGVPTVWVEGGTWRMLYRAYGSTQAEYAIGYATAPAASGPWTRAQTTPVITAALAKLPEVEAGPGRLIKVGATYYLFVSSITGERSVVVLTSTDLINWTRDNENPIWDAGRFCNCVWKQGDFYYSLVPIYRTGIGAPADIEIWRSTSPRFTTSTREYLGLALSPGAAGSWSEKCLDTPTVLTTDITKSAYPALTGGQPWVYFAGESNAGAWLSGLAKLSTTNPVFAGRWKGQTRYPISTLGAWAFDALPATRAGGYIYKMGDVTATRKYFVMPRSGHITGVAITSTQACTAGTVAATVVGSDGVAIIGLTATINTNAATSTTALVMIAPGIKPRPAGTQVGIALSSAGFAPAGVNITVEVFVAYEPY